jgi:hypothetical protein
MIVLKENERVSQIVVNEVSTAGEGSCMVVPTSLCTFTTPETSHAVIREVSTLLRGSLSMRENRSRLSGSRTLCAELTFDNFAAEGDANRFSTSDSQRSCAARSFEVPGAESCFITAITTTAAVASAATETAINHTRVRRLDGPRAWLPVVYLSHIAPGWRGWRQSNEWRPHRRLPARLPRRQPPGLA